VIYGAIGATTVAGIINTLYLVLMAILLVSQLGNGDGKPRGRTPVTTARLGCLRRERPVGRRALNEEFLKGMLVAFFLLPQRRRRCAVSVGASSPDGLQHPGDLRKQPLRS
jgi:hypothetical protein